MNFKEILIKIKVMNTAFIIVFLIVCVIFCKVIDIIQKSRHIKDKIYEFREGIKVFEAKKD